MIKLCLFLTALVAVVRAQRRDEEGPRPFQFSYQSKVGAQGEVGGSISHSQTGDANGRVEGIYELEIDDGRKRVVSYVADQDGFRAEVKSNEPGFSEEDPADITHSRLKK